MSAIFTEHLPAALRALVAAALMAGAALAAADEPNQVAISQAFAEGKDITVYLEVRDAADAFVPGLSADQLRATVGAHSAEIESIAPFAATDDGVTYLFLVDISKSLSQPRFEEIKAALNNWVDALRPQDRAGLMTFGTSVTTLAEPTGDQTKLKELIKDLKPTDDNTAFYRALHDGMKLAVRRGDSLPNRRVIVTLTDGVNDIDGEVLREEVKDLIETDPVPIYAIAYAPKGVSAAALAQGLDDLGLFARTSGGVRIAADAASDLPATFAALRQRIAEVYTLDLRCESCVADGGRHALIVTLTDQGGTVLSDRLSIIMPPEAPTPPPPEPETETQVEPEQEPEVEEEPPPEPKDETTTGSKPPELPGGSGVPLWAYWAAAGVALLPLLAWLLLRRRKPADDDQPPIDGDLDDGADDDADEDGDELGQKPGSGPFVTADDATARDLEFEREPFPDAMQPPPEPWAARDPQSKTLDRREPPRTPPPQANPKPSAPPGSIQLAFTTGPRSGQVQALTLRPSITIGRKPGNDLVLSDDAEVSSQHAALELLDNGRIVLRDLGSTNGTQLNGIAIQGTHPLADGDLVTIGCTEFRIKL